MRYTRSQNLVAQIHIPRMFVFMTPDACMQELVMGLLEHVKSREATPGSFADLLRQVRDPKTGAPLTAAQMLPEVAALFFAGIDTTGHTGAWTLCASALSGHPPSRGNKNSSQSLLSCKPGSR